MGWVESRSGVVYKFYFSHLECTSLFRILRHNGLLIAISWLNEWSSVQCPFHVIWQGHILVLCFSQFLFLMRYTCIADGRIAIPRLGRIGDGICNLFKKSNPGICGVDRFIRLFSRWSPIQSPVISVSNVMLTCYRRHLRVPHATVSEQVRWGKTVRGHLA